MRRNPAKRKTLTLQLEVSGLSRACYLRFSDLKVKKTEVLREWPLLAVDRAANGSVVGVESVGGDGFNLGEMLRAAGLRVSASLIDRINLTPKAACHEAEMAFA